MTRVGLSQFGPVPSTRVSGLATYQERFRTLLSGLGLDVRGFHFVAGASEDSADVIAVERSRRRFYMREEARQFGLPYPRSSVQVVERLVRHFERERLEALVIIEWMPVGMALWDAALKWGGPTIFLPTEHGAVCPYGFLLHGSGAPCAGPLGADGCEACTHGLDPETRAHPLEAPWYSRRHRAFQRIARLLPSALARPALWVLSETLQRGHVQISQRESVARIHSARRFLKTATAVLYQSATQHQVFATALQTELPVRLPMVLPLPALFIRPELPREGPSGPLRFVFAARPDYDRGLWLLLEAWERWRPAPAEATLTLATHEPGPALRGVIERLRSLGTGIELRIGTLTPADLVSLHREHHVYVNPAVWREPLSSSVLEGLSLGTPAIVPTGSGSADFVREGKSGWVYGFRDPASLASALRRASSGRESWQAASAGAFQASLEVRGESDRLVVQLKGLLQSRTVP